jgi:hypothetical protein
MLTVAVLAACGHAERDTSTAGPSNGPANLNRVSASELVRAFVDAGLPASNPRDVTALKCSKLQCLQAVDTDTVSILKFPASGPAQLYAGSISNSYQLQDVVVTFAPTVTSDLKARYEHVVERAAA